MKKKLIIVERKELEESFRSVAAELLSGAKSSKSPDYYTRDELCKHLGISYSTLFNYEKEGIITKHKQGRRNLYKRTEIEDLQKSGRLHKYSGGKQI